MIEKGRGQPPPASRSSAGSTRSCRPAPKHRRVHVVAELVGGKPQFGFKAEIGGGVFRLTGFCAGHDEIQLVCLQPSQMRIVSLLPMRFVGRRLFERHPYANKFLRNKIRGKTAGRFMWSPRGTGYVPGHRSRSAVAWETKAWLSRKARYSQWLRRVMFVIGSNPVPFPSPVTLV
jgi:hypothetical protein